MAKTGLAIATALFVTLSCGGSGESSGSGGSAGQAGDGGGSCPTGQCLGDGGCLEATGPTGNGLCVDPNGTCSGCKCASPDTPIATPAGERRIADLKVGDWVYSVDHGRVRAVPLLETRRTPVSHHSVVRVRLATGPILEISPVHPTGDGRTFAELEAGARLDGVPIVSAELVRYSGRYTHDILPASDTGTYFAGGVLIGSTLAHRTPLESRETMPASAGP